MGDLRTVVCRPSSDRLERLSVSPEYVVGMASTGLVTGVAVYVVEDDALRKFAAGLEPGIVIDRGRKHQAKPLSRYFQRSGCVFRITTGYSHAGQTERGVRALLQAAVSRGQTGRFFVGVGHAVFAALWEQAGDDHARATRAMVHPLAVQAHEALHDLIALHPKLQAPDSVRVAYVGESPAVQLVRFLIVLAAKCDFPILIEGDSGTGKEVVARQIHALHTRTRLGKCVCVNCGGIPGELLESELFGHEKGAFTSATEKKTGLWEDAHGGTLFLDEIADLAPRHQVKVLRALEDGTFHRVGGVREIKSDARVLAATNRSLEELVRSGDFREDLYYRLVCIKIRTPALREHPEDIPAIARHLWANMKPHSSQKLPDEVCDLLKQLALPGNARELRSILYAVAMMADGNEITTRTLRAALRERRSVLRDE